MAFIGLGLAQATGLLGAIVISGGAPGVRLALGGLLMVGGGGVLVALWRRRGTNWSYAITDRRLLSVCGRRLRRSVTPEEVESFARHGDIAYWRLLTPRILRRAEARQRENRYPGFHGLEDPADMVETLEDWRNGFTQRAGQDASDFVRGVQGSRPLRDLPEGARRLRHALTGLSLDVPAGWDATISLDRIGPLKIFGVTVLERFIRPGPEQSYAEGAAWNTLTLRGAPDAGLNLTVLEEEMSKTLEAVLADPWAKRFNLEVLETTPDMEIGGLAGFSLVRQMPAGANIASFGRVAAPVATRHVWLGKPGMHIEIIGMARLDQPDIQRAVDAMIDSIHCR